MKQFRFHVSYGNHDKPMYDFFGHQLWHRLSLWSRYYGRMDFPSFARIGTLSSAPIVSIVDDDESVRVATTKLVRVHGFVAHGFASAEEFLQSPHAKETSCLITDVRMPGMSGVELQSHLIRQGRRLPIIFMTAFPEADSQKRALAAGAVCFLTKPFDGQTLIDYLSDALKAAK